MSLQETLSKVFGRRAKPQRNEFSDELDRYDQLSAEELQDLHRRLAVSTLDNWLLMH